MSCKTSAYKKLIALSFAAVFIVMLCLSALTPMLADDYSYSFSYADRSPIDSLGDIIASLAAHRDTMNGRMTAHFFAHLFLMLPKTVFNIVNALVATAITVLFYLYIRCGKDRRDFFLLLSGLFLVWLFTPVFGQVFLWLDGACNYSWALLFILAFIYPMCDTFIRGKKCPAFYPPHLILYTFLAFLAGSYSEGASFATLFVAFCFIVCIWYRDKKAPVFFILALFAACLGYLFLMTAPSEWSGRTGSFSLEVIAKNIKRMISAPYETMLPLFVLFGILFAACISFKARIHVIITAAILFLGAWVSLLLFAVAIYFPWRSLLMMCLLLVLACLIMLSELCEKGFDKFLPMAFSALAVLFVFQFALGLGDVANVYSQYRQRVSHINATREAGLQQIWLPAYVADTKYSGAYLLADIYEDCWSWPNYDLAEYYGIAEIYAQSPSE